MGLASSDLTTESFTPVDLFAGSTDVNTDQGTLVSGQNLAKWTVLGRIAATGKLTQLAPAASDGSQNACAILVEAIDATSGDKACQIYVSGDFNHEALVWPAGTAVDTLLERQAAFSRSPIRVKALYYSA